MKLAAKLNAVALCGIWLLTGTRCPSQDIPATTAQPETQLSRAGSGIMALQNFYSEPTGLYNTTGWWNSANATTVLVDYARVSKSTRFNGILANTFQRAQNKFPSFLNHFYDDEGWWALAWIDAYDLTGNREYLLMAESIFADMSGGWDDTCGGGIWWSKDRKYKNAIANELFLSVSAHLANRDGANSSQFIDWANKEWGWFVQSGMINAAGLINDGLDIKNSSSGTSCKNNGKNTWSYNQGVVLGGLTELAKLNADSSLRQAAEKIATAAVTDLVDAHGVMHDPCEPNCGADGVQFKGIFVRNLLAMNNWIPKSKYQSFIVTNANAIWSRSQGAGHLFGQVWSGPVDAANAASQSSALDAIVSAAALESRPANDAKASPPR